MVTEQPCLRKKKRGTDINAICLLVIPSFNHVDMSVCPRALVFCSLQRGSQEWETTSSTALQKNVLKNNKIELAVSVVQLPCICFKITWSDSYNCKLFLPANNLSHCFGESRLQLGKESHTSSPSELGLCLTITAALELKRSQYRKLQCVGILLAPMFPASGCGEASHSSLLSYLKKLFSYSTSDTEPEAGRNN